MNPIQIKFKYGVFIGLIATIIGLIASIDKLLKFVISLFYNDTLLNWRFFSFGALLLCFIVWFIMNHYWSKEFKEHEETKFERDNLLERLKIEESERLIDIVTGIPNMKSLELDLTEFFNEKRKIKEIQFILIDLRNFRRINKEYGFIKTNKILRMIAQSIYVTMRRNEDMYKYPMSDEKRKSFIERFYRIHAGGDEFAFIIEGEQSDAIGFVNRLVPRFIKEFTNKTEKILGKKEKLSFYSSIVKISARDNYDDILDKAHDCYNLAKESKAKFSLSWYPHDIEENIPDKDWRKNNYIKAHDNFKVILNKHD